MPFLDIQITFFDDGSLFFAPTGGALGRHLTSISILSHIAPIGTQRDKICIELSDREKEKEHVARALYTHVYPKGLIAMGLATLLPFPATSTVGHVQGHSDPSILQTETIQWIIGSLDIHTYNYLWLLA